MVKRVEILIQCGAGIRTRASRDRTDFQQFLGLKVAQLVEQTSEKWLQRPIRLLLSLAILN